MPAQRPRPSAADGASDPGTSNDKVSALETFRSHPEDGVLTTDQGVPIPHTDDSLKAGERGPSLLEDFHLREKITRFDHERIPERVVHARGSGAHGFFQVYRPLTELTRAAFLQDPAARTPVFVRFSTVQGSRGSFDLARDVRGFATKFYTTEGNFDLVGNNMPVFFIQDGIKFPDVVHAVKPEPDSEMPQAASAHDTFWDFIGLVPETAHHMMWLMSDRGIPRSFATMEGFGIHTFRFVNAEGQWRFVKFHWKPLAGIHSVVWDEAQKINGMDPDYHRRGLWESIEAGSYPEYELGIQVFDEAQADAFPFDILDATKIVPEELVPVERVGRLTLNRNPDNFFAETEQVAFHVGNLVPGIDVTNDPLMQARLFSYLDTQLTRLGGPNFHEIPINRPIAPVHNHQQDGFHRDTINTGKANYFPNSIGGGCPVLAPGDQGYVHVPEMLQGPKTRERAPSFKDFFSQASLFFHSLSLVEQQHLVSALRFELGKVQRATVRERVVNEILANIDIELARAVGPAVGVPNVERRPARDAGPPVDQGLAASAALSQLSNPGQTVAGRQVAVLCADGVDAAAVEQLTAELAAAGVNAEVVSTFLGPVQGAGGGALEATKMFSTVGSVLFDAVYVPGGATSIAALRDGAAAVQFVKEAHAHYKPIAASGEGAELVRAAIGMAAQAEPASAGGDPLAGVVLAETDTATLGQDFLAAIARHRFWERDQTQQMGSSVRP
ncbi:MAG: catalase [Dehalococcoidia bacterium]|nr:catalase [Dehalococcoidia bacterium]